jgi:serine/threonine protein kinase
MNVRSDMLELVTVSRDNYIFGGEVARGGMGRILRARDRRLGREVAVKELLSTTGDMRRRFEREIRITARLQHPTIVSVHEAGVFPDGQPFYVMKLIAGESLDRVIANTTSLHERMPLLPSVLAVVDALAYAHSHGIIHRDLKPHNVLVGRFGETVVVDWGLAKNLAEPESAHIANELFQGPCASDEQTALGEVMGTPAYMPPEQAAGVGLDARADVYALGALLYHTLGGVPPYSGENKDEILAQVQHVAPRPLAEITAGIPRDLLTIVGKAMARAPTDRYPTARELANDLRRYQTGQLVASHRYSTWQLFERFVRRHRAVLAVTVVLLTALLVTVTISVRRIIAERNTAERERITAEEMVDFMVYELRDKLEPIGRLDLLGTVAERAQAYYSARDPASISGDNLRRQAAARSQGRFAGSITGSA